MVGLLGLSFAFGMVHESAVYCRPGKSKPLSRCGRGVAQWRRFDWRLLAQMPLFDSESDRFDHRLCAAVVSTATGRHLRAMPTRLRGSFPASKCSVAAVASVPAGHAAQFIQPSLSSQLVREAVGCVIFPPQRRYSIGPSCTPTFLGSNTVLQSLDSRLAGLPAGVMALPRMRRPFTRVLSLFMHTCTPVMKACSPFDPESLKWATISDEVAPFDPHKSFLLVESRSAALTSSDSTVTRQGLSERSRDV